AARLGYTEGNYAAWEAGNSTPRALVEVAKRIADLTGADPLWLMGWFDENAGPGGPGPDDGGGASPTSTKWERSPRWESPLAA
ncbi:MAG TPA: helix-turn-helix transcriptional regulator, partial [Acidimicrobiales bacterium]|nr:helix-turn-helix transcriptional regulator [Acidimicrobiales bacterium]